MTAAGARDAVNGAALVVAGLYFYRKLIEPESKTPKPQPRSVPQAALQVVGVGPLASTGRFIVGFGVTFMGLSLVEGISPDLAGYFAILIAVGSILGNGSAASEDVRDQLSEKNRALSKLAGEAEPDRPTVMVASWEGRSGTRVKTV